jgi:hypothetical protein
VLLVYAGLRVSLPLGHLGHQSQLARLHARLLEAEAAGRPIEFPVVVRQHGGWPARYFFADDFEIVVTHPRRGYFELYEKGDPRAARRAAALEARSAASRR